MFKIMLKWFKNVSFIFPTILSLYAPLPWVIPTRIISIKAETSSSLLLDLQSFKSITRSFGKNTLFKKGTTCKTVKQEIKGNYSKLSN